MPPTQIHLWDRRFLLRATSFLLPRAARPHKRLAVTLLVARGQPFRMDGVGAPGQRYRGVLLAPNVPRLSLEATDSQLTLLDAGVGTAACQRLLACVGPGQARELSAVELERLQPVLDGVSGRSLDASAASAHYESLVEALAGPEQAAPALDVRVQRAMALIEAQPLDALTMAQLAQVAGVSPSRLRALFQQSYGCAPASVARWVNAWKAIRRWRGGARLTDLALDAGFHDLSHIDHAIKELFGLNPSAIARSQQVQLIQCEG